MPNDDNSSSGLYLALFLSGFFLVCRHENVHFSEGRTGGMPWKSVTCLSLSLRPASLLHKQSRTWILIQKVLKGCHPPSLWNKYFGWERWVRILSLFRDNHSEKIVLVLVHLVNSCASFKTLLNSNISTFAQFFMVPLGPEIVAISSVLPNTSIHSFFKNIQAITIFEVYSKQTTHSFCSSELSSKQNVT